METYTLPREVFNLLVEALGGKQKAEIFANAMESVINAIRKQAIEEIVEKKEISKIEIKQELKNTLVTREIFEERFKVVDERFKSVEGMIKTAKVELDRKFTIMFLILLFTTIFLNQNALKFIAELMGLIKP
jgi:hypothetical protein